VSIPVGGSSPNLADLTDNNLATCITLTDSIADGGLGEWQQFSAGCTLASALNKLLNLL
jgi:hypothetical protein